VVSWETLSIGKDYAVRDLWAHADRGTTAEAFSEPVSAHGAIVLRLHRIEKMSDLTQPANIHWVDGSQTEYNCLCDLLVEVKTFCRLDDKLWPGCFYARSAPTTSPASKTARSFAHTPKKALVRPTTGKIRSSCAGSSSSFFVLHARPHHVRAPFSMGPSDPPCRKSASSLPTRPTSW